MSGEKYIVVYGNPIDGFAFYGTFDSHADANYWASEHCEFCFNITLLQKTE